MSPCHGATVLALLLTALVSRAGAAGAADERSEALCATAWASPPAELDLQQAEREASELQDRGDPKAIDLACQAWAVARRRHGDTHPGTTRWLSNLGIGLFTRGATDDAALLLGQAWSRAAAQGDEGAVVARRSAAVISMTHIQRQQMADALAWSGRAVTTLNPQDAPTQDSVRLQLNHASLLSMERRPDEARALFSRLLDQVRTDPAQFVPETVGILHQWAVAERRQARLDEAIRLNEQNIAFQRRWTPDKPLAIGLALHNQGLLLRAHARYDEAEALLREALAESRDATTPDLFQARANMRDTLASLLVERGRPAEALPLAREAVALVAAGPEAGTGAALRPLRRQAEAQAALGDLAGAVETWRQALDIMRSRPDAGDAETRVQSWLAYARAMLLLGSVADAAQALDQADAEAARRSSPADERAQRQQLRAALLRAQGRDADALQALRAADLGWAELHPPTHPQRVRVAASVCELGQACDALASADADTLPPDAAAQRALALSLSAQRAGRATDAEVHARDALLAAYAAADPALLWRAHADYARLQADAGRMFEASFFGKRALAIVQAQRENLLRHGSVGDEAYLHDKAALYRQVADWLLRQQRMAEALEVMRLLKRSEQADYSERAGAGDALSLTAAELALQQRLDEVTTTGRDDTRELQRLLQLQRAQRLTAAEVQRLADLQRAWSADRDSARTRLDAALASVRAVARAAPSDGGGARFWQVARPGELRAWLLLTERELVAMFATSTRRWVRRVPLDSAAPLATRIADLLDRLQQRQPAHGQLQSLYELVGRPLDQAAREAGTSRLLLWLDGPLRYLPVGLLHDGQRPLADKLVLSLSADDPVGSAAPTAAAPAARPRLRAFGVTRAHAGMPALPAVADELCAIVDGPVRGLTVPASGCRDGDTPQGRGPMRGQADADQRFTEAALRSASLQADVLHIGTHFVLRPGNVSRSWLLLGDGRRLALQRLQALDLGAPRLVTLSACDTAVPGGGADGREIDGLAATWLTKGASQVLASLWRVNDRDTARFMQRFYRELARSPDDAALALQRAQRAAWRSGVPPPDWGAFTLTSRR